MTRIKKSRTAGQNGVRHKPASDARQERERPVETKKKGAGLKSGSRNSQLDDKVVTATERNKDPRHGSKKPIALVLDPLEQKLLEKAPNIQPKAQLSKVRPVVIPPEQELALLEQDEQLLDLVERVEQGEILTGKEAKYFNQKSARHDELLSMLGLDQDEADEQPTEELDPLAQFEKTDWRKDLLGE